MINKLNNNTIGQKIKLVSKSNLIYQMISLSIYLAYFIASGFSVFLAYLPFGPTWLTFLPLIVGIATFHLGFFGALVSGLGFGISSFIASLLLGLFWFQNVDISILSRILVGLTTFLFYFLLNLRKKPKLWKFVLLVLIATEANSVFVFGSLYFHSKFIGELVGLPDFKTILALNTINLIAEPIFNVIMASLVFFPILAIRKKYEQRKNTTW
ncbi:MULTISPECIES: hypothetical protein [unclassified Mycoplasma]|uniref:hypothetical protein n=1 Tax=unclassified Mycoplasma TaxID=2683645 RepID=UPI00216B5168|nr:MULTISPECIES: hypothetical protein [unclassified Mycoplasma]MCS4536628.1 hypothetical protein [Mycoplasma sp. CSL7475-4]MCT4469552.1 hypothetical protein [Mycoplasma sp. HS2188]